MDLMECLAEIMIKYYYPIEMIEHKYKTKVIAVGLLKKAQFNEPMYLDYYYQRLVSYKSLILDHMDNLKIAANIAQNTFRKVISDLFGSFILAGKESDTHLINNLVRLLYPRYANVGDDKIKPVRESFLNKFGRQSAYPVIAAQLLHKYFRSPNCFDVLGEKIVKICLSSVTLEDLGNRIKEAVYNFYVYGLYSKLEKTNVYMINMQTKTGIVSMKYFTKLPSLARVVINKVGDYITTLNYFGQVWMSYEEIRKLFEKQGNIKVLFY